MAKKFSHIDIKKQKINPIIPFFFLGLLFGLSFYQNSNFVREAAPFWVISLIVPISLYLLFLHYKKSIHCLLTSLKLGFIFGLGFFAMGTYWLFKAPFEVMNIGLFASILVFLILISLFSLTIFPFFGIIYFAINIKKQIKVRFKPIQKPQFKFIEKIKRVVSNQTFLFCLVLPSFWTVLEWIRAEVFFMPLLSIAHPQIHNFLSSFASLFGVYGISFSIWLLTGLIFIISQTHPKKISIHIWVVAIIVFSLFLYHQNQNKMEFKSENEKQKFTVVQGNVGQNIKFDGLDIEDEIRRYFYLSSEVKNSIIIWPETAIADFRKNVTRVIEENLDKIKNNNSVIFSGIVLQETDLVEDKDSIAIENKNKYYTSLANLENSSQSYSKTKLVIFGEYIPFLDLLHGILKKIQTPFSSYSKGAADQKEISFGNAKMAVGICFEGAYGRLYERYKNSNVLVNISNDAWFDSTAALPILLNSIRFRSIEMGQFMIRSANTGISAFINPNGKIISYLPPYIAGAISMDIPLIQSNTLYSKLGNIPAIGLSLLFICLFLMAFIPNKPKQV